MSIRLLLLAAIIFYLTASPLHGKRDNDPWYYLEKGIKDFSVEQSFYMLHAFVPERNVDLELLAQTDGFPAGSRSTGSGSLIHGLDDAEWSAGRAGEPGYMLFRVGGENLEHCRFLWGELQRAVDCTGTVCGLAWTVEVYTGDEAADLTDIGHELLKRLGATALAGNSYNGTLQILGHVPWYDQFIDLAEGPVNLDIELFFDPYRQQVRIRAGVPVLVTSFDY